MCGSDSFEIIVSAPRWRVMAWRDKAVIIRELERDKNSPVVQNNN